MPDKHGNITVSDVEEVMNGISGQRQAMTFDMQKARQYAETSPLMSHAPYIVALDEIERQSKRIAELDAEAQSYHDRKEEFAGRIAELEAENERLRQWGISNATDAAQEKVKGEKLRTALKKLGQALTEERALAIECNPNRTREWTHEQAIERARDQLRREGVI